MTGTQKRIVFLMRGLPGTGKSHMAQRLAGTDGIVLETDEYFLTQVGTDPGSFDYDEKLLPAAREWNLNRFRNALQHTSAYIEDLIDVMQNRTTKSDILDGIDELWNRIKAGNY